MLNLISSEKNDYFLIADLHLDGTIFPEYNEIVSTLKEHKDYGVIFVGDTLNARYTMEKALEDYPELFDAVKEMKSSFFIKGNNDPDISDLYVVYDVHQSVKICHGNVLPECVNRALNKFKPRTRKFPEFSEKKKERLLKGAKKLFEGERIIMGHLHFEYFDKANCFYILAPRKIYSLNQILTEAF